MHVLETATSWELFHSGLCFSWKWRENETQTSGCFSLLVDLMSREQPRGSAGSLRVLTERCASVSDCVPTPRSQQSPWSPARTWWRAAAEGGWSGTKEKVMTSDSDVKETSMSRVYLKLGFIRIQLKIPFFWRNTTLLSFLLRAKEQWPSDHWYYRYVYCN